MGSCGAEKVGELEGELEGAVAAHRETRHHTAFPGGNGGEPFVNKTDDIINDVAFIPGSIFSIGVETAATVGEDEQERKVRCISLNGCISRPGGIIIRQAMEEIEHRVAAIG